MFRNVEIVLSLKMQGGVARMLHIAFNYYCSALFSIAALEIIACRNAFPTPLRLSFSRMMQLTRRNHDI